MSDFETPTPVRKTNEGEISFWEIMAVLMRRRGTVAVFTLLVSSLAAVYGLVQPLTYTTSAAFRPQGSEQGGNSQLAALAGQLGVNVGGGTADEASPQFYQELLVSREILTSVSDEPFAVHDVGIVQLKDLLEIVGDSEAFRDEEVLEWLRTEAVSVSTSRETGTVTISVKTEWPDLSVKIAEELLTEVALFNMDTRQSQAASERVFIETRVEEAEANLEDAEDNLRSFLETNRQWENSPMLTFQHDGLRREVGLRQSVLTTMVQSYEQARISEVRDTPVITVLQSPFFPALNDPRRLVFITVLGSIIGGMIGIMLAFLSEAIRRPRTGDPARNEFEESWHEAVRGVPLLGGRGD
ncbi:MAG: hypothetical protein CMH51_02585 [Myxococcales bacterium]|nr:hypothetical protein [Myxococcales bacterium]|tara:strand:- start:299 stop:1363 length:1065 start_codon:yes stop_codon:yes gene_type:complete